VKTVLFAAALATRIVIDHTPAHFKIRDGVRAKASVMILAGTPDSNSASLSALTDGALPTDEDQPANNVFFRAGSWGGRIRFDFGGAIDIAEIRTYSWHSDSRAPQVYKVFGSDESDPNFNAEPAAKLDPEASGWKLIVFVDTRTTHGDDGGPYVVSVSENLGHHRYLLFDVFETESDDPWGNTFYSEIEVISGERASRPHSMSVPLADFLRSDRARCPITAAETAALLEKK